MAGKDVAHGGAVEKRLAARRHAHRRRHVDELHHAALIEALEAPCGNRRAERAPGAVRMDRDPHLRRAAHARAHFVPQGNRHQELRARRPCFLAKRERRRQHLNAGMTLGDEVPFVELEPGTCRAVEKRCVPRCRAPARAENPRFTRGGLVALEERLHLGLLHAGGDDRQAVRHDPARALENLRGQIGKPRAARKCREFLQITQSIFAPETFTTSAHFFTSARIQAENSSGELPTMSAPCAVSWSRTSGARSTRTTSEFRRKTISRGVPAGASRPFQPTASKSLSPSSCSVGTSGSTPMRARLVTASAWIFPERTCGRSGGTLSNIIGICPAMRSAIAGAPPL